MKVLLSTIKDNANTGWRYAQCLELLGYEVHTIKRTGTKAKHPRQMKVSPELKKQGVSDFPFPTVRCTALQSYFKQFDVIHFMASSFIDSGLNLKKKKVLVNHGGSIYRNNPEQVSRFFNRLVDFSIVQTPALFNLGAKNEKWIVSPVDTDFIKPDYHPLKKKLILGHFPSRPMKKGSGQILEVVKQFKQFDYVGNKSISKFGDFTTWENNINRIRKCDVVIETLKTNIHGKQTGGWGNSALEAAAAGTIVITNYVQKKEYEKVYGEIPFLVANNKKQLKTQLEHVLGMNELEIALLKQATRAWAVQKHGFRPTARRLHEEVYSLL